MFWKRLDNNTADNTPGDFRGFLADRLRLAFDLATLGAYELTESDRRSGEPESGPGASSPCVERATRVHVTGARAGCRQTTASDASKRCAWQRDQLPPTGYARGHAAGTRARLRVMERRAGTASTPQQPCTWIG
jgi:hypothetical protein